LGAPAQPPLLPALGPSCTGYMLSPHDIPLPHHQLVLELEGGVQPAKFIEVDPSCIGGVETHPLDQQFMAAAWQTALDDIGGLQPGVAMADGGHYAWTGGLLVVVQFQLPHMEDMVQFGTRRQLQTISHISNAQGTATPTGMAHKTLSQASPCPP
jgi:hypothetical protein